MKRIILLIVTLGLISAVSYGQQIIFIVDNVPVKDFDGSVLKGKTIKDYTVTTMGSGRNAAIVHSITTERGSSSMRPYLIDFVGDNTAAFRWKSDSTIVRLPGSHEGRAYINPDSQEGRNYVYYIDGVEYPESTLRSLSPGEIKNISIVKTDNGLNLIKIETGKAEDELERVLKMLPGVEHSSDGSWTVNGQPVTEMVINGRKYSIQPSGSDDE